MARGISIVGKLAAGGLLVALGVILLLRLLGVGSGPGAVVDRELGAAYFEEERYEPTMNTWLRARGELPDEPELHQCILAYASDLSVMVPTIHPHHVGLMSPGVHSASLDHAMWFHRPLRVDD